MKTIFSLLLTAILALTSLHAQTENPQDINSKLENATESLMNLKGKLNGPPSEKFEAEIEQVRDVSTQALNTWEKTKSETLLQNITIFQTVLNEIFSPVPSLDDQYVTLSIKYPKEFEEAISLIPPQLANSFRRTLTGMQKEQIHGNQ